MGVPKLWGAKLPVTPVPRPPSSASISDGKTSNSLLLSFGVADNLDEPESLDWLVWGERLLFLFLLRPLPVRGAWSAGSRDCLCRGEAGPGSKEGDAGGDGVEGREYGEGGEYVPPSLSPGDNLSLLPVGTFLLLLALGEVLVPFPPVATPLLPLVATPFLPLVATPLTGVPSPLLPAPRLSWRDAEPLRAPTWRCFLGPTCKQ